MPDYEKMYFALFSAICKAIEPIDETNYGIAKQCLIRAQQETEELYIMSAEQVAMATCSHSETRVGMKLPTRLS